MNSYSIATRNFYDRWRNRGLIIQRFHTDYEQSEIQAVSKVIGDDKLYGCHFHLARAILRHIQKIAPQIRRNYDTAEKNNPTSKWVK